MTWPPGSAVSRSRTLDWSTWAIRAAPGTSPSWRQPPALSQTARQPALPQAGTGWAPGRRRPAESHAATGHGATCPLRRWRGGSTGLDPDRPQPPRCSRSCGKPPRERLILEARTGGPGRWPRREDRGPGRKTLAGALRAKIREIRCHECDEQMVTPSRRARCFNEPGPQSGRPWDAPGWRPPRPRAPQVETWRSSLDISMTKGQPPGAPSQAARPGCLPFVSS